MDVFDKATCIEEHHDTVKSHRRRMENAKAIYDAEKKAYEAAIKRRDLVIELGENALKEQQPLLDEAGSDHTNGAKNGAAKAKKPSKAAANEAAINAAAAPSDAWKSLPVSDAIKIGAVISGLDTLDKPVRTLGELGAWLNEPGNRLTNLPGVGDEKMSKALDQFAEFWKDHPEYTR